MKTILITGGTGLVGHEIVRQIKQLGWQVKLLTRNEPMAKSNPICYFWNTEIGIIDPKAFEDVDYIIHLAGQSVADGRWNKKQKADILNSRVQTTRVLIGVEDIAVWEWSFKNLLLLLGVVKVPI